MTDAVFEIAVAQALDAYETEIAPANVAYRAAFSRALRAYDGAALKEADDALSAAWNRALEVYLDTYKRARAELEMRREQP